MSTPAAGVPEVKSSLSFTQGLLLGQLSIVILIGAFIKFFIFGDPPNADATAALRATERRSRTLAHKHSLLTLRAQQQQQQQQQNQQHTQPTTLRDASGTHHGLSRKRSSVLRTGPVLTPATILSKTYYNVNSHQPESLDWFNVLIAQTIAQIRSDAQRDNAILQSLTEALNGSTRPDFVDEIKVTELSLGEDFPIFSNCRIIPVDEDGLAYGSSAGTGMGMGMGGGRGRGAGVENASLPREGGRLQARMDVDLSDFITLALETKLVLNFPKPRVAVLPVAISVSVVRFSGTLCLSFMPSSNGPHPGAPNPTVLGFHFLDDYRLDFSIRSLVGSRSRLQDVPKIAQLVEARLHMWFDERCVEPVFQQIPLPNFWPRKKNTRGGDETAAGDGAVPGTSHSRHGSMSRAMGKDVQRDLREEARREVEAEERMRERELLREEQERHRQLRERERQRERDRARSGEVDGMRYRRRDRSQDQFTMPGSLPGMTMP